jgi:hypothetical protein
MKILAIALALTLVLSVAATAGQNPNVKAVVHVQAYASKASCTNLVPTFTSCDQFVTTFPTYAFHALPVFFDTYGITGAEYSLVWPGTSSAGWIPCSDFSIGGIVNSGDPVSQTWSLCQIQYATICGLAWVFAGGPGFVCMVPNADSGFFGVTDCEFQTDVPMCIFCAGVLGEIGDDACAPTATEASTWGGIKSMFK